MATIQERAYDSARLRRAATRGVKRLGGRRYLVEGRVYPTYIVDLDGDPMCECADMRWHGEGHQCLQVLAARLNCGDGALILDLGMMLRAAERAAELSARRSRRAS